MLCWKTLTTRCLHILLTPRLIPRSGRFRYLYRQRCHQHRPALNVVLWLWGPTDRVCAQRQRR